jgi:K+-transporting ATPase A subunit
MRTFSTRKSGKRSQVKVSKIENVGMKAIFFSVLVMPLLMLMKRATINRKIRGYF